MELRPIELLAAQYAAERDATLAEELAFRRAHGVVHTPGELARAVVRVSDELLRERFELSAGLCDPALLLIDPACGPGAFLAAVLALAQERGVTGPRAVGFDVDAAALAWAQRLQGQPEGRALELVHGDVLGSDVLEQRASAHAGPLCMVGNPPWATARARPSALDQARLEAFRCDADGVRLPERKLGVLSDAYVRFFALCAQLARGHQAGALLALVTNASFLDGPVHRGMRARLREWFDEILVLDLGGSALLGRRRERRDDNVFGVRPNVAVTWLCRYPRQGARAIGALRYARHFGSRAQKLGCLGAASLHELGMSALSCEPPAHSFVPRPRRDARYAGFPSLAEWLPFHREGVQSNRDAVVIDDSAERLLARLWAFRSGERLPELAQAYRQLSHYDPERARAALSQALDRDPDGAAGISVRRIAYRPFDERFLCPIPPLCHRPRPLLAAALSHGGHSLVCVRKDRGDLPWAHVAFASSLVDNCLLSARSSCRARAFPAYTPDGQANLGSGPRELLDAIGCGSATAQDVQHYLLCVLSAAGYQRCWDSELHDDYPRVPAPREASSFDLLCALGARLSALHVEPLHTSWAAPQPEPGARFGDIVLDVKRAQLRLAGSVLLELEPAALTARVGHHEPLRALLALRAAQPLDAAGLRVVYALAERLRELTRLQEQATRAVSECLGPFERVMTV